MGIEFHRDGPWPLPEGWVWTRLGPLGRWSGGGTPSKSNPSFWTRGTIPWVSPKDMKVPLIEATEDLITEEAVAKSSTKLVPSGSVLMVVRSGILNHTFPVAVAAQAVTLNQDMRAMIPHSGINARYMSFLLRRLQRHILEECSKDGTTVASVEPAKLEQVWVPIAPTAEQRRIVARIDELFTEIADGETAIARAGADLNTWRRALLKAAVTGELTRDWREQNNPSRTGHEFLTSIRQSTLGTASNSVRQSKRGQANARIELHYAELPSIPVGWVWTRIGEVGSVTGGITKNQSRTEFDKKLPFLRVANIQYGELDLSDVHEIGVRHGELERVLLKKNDLLIVEGNGSVSQIGRCALWTGEIEPCVHQNHLIKIRFCEEALADWAARWLMAPHGRQLVTRVASSTSGLHTLSLSKIEAIPIPVPPQAEMVEILRMMNLESEVEGSLEVDFEYNSNTLLKLRQAILKTAFEGRLLDQKPADEPAQDLLARLDGDAAARSKPRRRRQPARKPRAPGSKGRTNVEHIGGAK